MKEIRTFKAGEPIPTEGKFLFFHPGDQAYHYEVPVKGQADKAIDIEARHLISKVISHLNLTAGTKFLVSSKSAQKHILARINEGRKFEDFKKVIDSKFLEWGHDPHWSRYLRPETLFGSKFDSYLGGKGDELDPFQELDQEMEKIK